MHYIEDDDADDVERVLFSISRMDDGRMRFHLDKELSAQGILLLASSLRLAEEELMLAARKGCYNAQEKE